jgi:hypothetical protein
VFALNPLSFASQISKSTLIPEAAKSVRKRLIFERFPGFFGFDVIAEIWIQI